MYPLFVTLRVALLLGSWVLSLFPQISGMEPQLSTMGEKNTSVEGGKGGRCAKIVPVLKKRKIVPILKKSIFTISTGFYFSMRVVSKIAYQLKTKTYLMTFYNQIKISNIKTKNC